MGKIAIRELDINQDITNQESGGAQNELSTSLADVLSKLSPDQLRELIDQATRLASGEQVLPVDSP